MEGSHSVQEETRNVGKILISKRKIEATWKTEV